MVNEEDALVDQTTMISSAGVQALPEGIRRMLYQKSRSPEEWKELEPTLRGFRDALRAMGVKMRPEPN